MNNRIFELEELKNQLSILLPENVMTESDLLDRLKMEFNFNSNRLAGNQLTYPEARALLKQGIASGGKPFRDYLEMRGCDEAVDFVVEAGRMHDELTEAMLRKLHVLILKEPYTTKPDINQSETAIIPGKYRSAGGSISISPGKSVRLPAPKEIKPRIQSFLEELSRDLSEKGGLTINLAAGYHNKFLEIMPFADGNGRIARLILNYILIYGGYPPAIIPAGKKDEYLEAIGRGRPLSDDLLTEIIIDELRQSMEFMIKALKQDYSPQDIDNYSLSNEMAVFPRHSFLETKNKEVVFESLEKYLISIFLEISELFFPVNSLFNKYLIEFSIKYSQDGRIQTARNSCSFMNDPGDARQVFLNSLSQFNMVENIQKRPDISEYIIRWHWSDAVLNNPGTDIDIEIPVHFGQSNYTVNKDIRLRTSYIKFYNEGFSRTESTEIARELYDELRHLLKIKKIAGA